jgi:hypothetical protein
VLRRLVARHRPAVDGLTALAVTGARSGLTFRFPVMCAPLGHSSLVVLPGHASHKTWWHQLGRRPDVEVLDSGAWLPARARVVGHGTLEWSVARSAYVARRPHARIEDGPLVVVDLSPTSVWRRDQGPVAVGPDAVGASQAAS